MVERYNPPTRAQIARMADDDERMIRALETLFQTGGQGIPDLEERLDEIEDKVDANTARIKTNEVLLWLSM